jgi:hypothetical protein
LLDHVVDLAVEAQMLWIEIVVLQWIMYLDLQFHSSRHLFSTGA